MSRKGLGAIATSVMIGLFLNACGGSRQGDSDELSGQVLVDGSSTVYPISEAVGEEFTIVYPSVRIPVGVSGTGGGFSKFFRREVDITDASRPIKETELALSERNGVSFIELPVAYDGLAVLVNPQNNWVDCLTVDELRRIWEPDSQLDNWSQVRPGFPNRPLTLYGPGTDSGTYDYFTEAIGGHEGASRTDFTSSEDDNVLVQGLQGDPNALGFIGLAYYEENQDRLTLVAVDDDDDSNGAGCISPSQQTVRDRTYQPLSRPLFIYVRVESADRPAVSRFVEFYLEHAVELVPEVGYVPLTENGYRLSSERFARRVEGSLFAGGGSQVGASIEALMEEAMSDSAAPAPTPAP